MNKAIAECVGLWLAEGDKKCNNEINFCNNCFPLIKQFDSTLSNLFDANNKRIYIYSPNNKKIKVPIKCITKQYLDKRATKPYLIWRLASMDYNKKWKRIVKKISLNKKYYPYILKGFFAGEGSVKEGPNHNRSLKMSQSKKVPVINRALKFLKISYKFSLHHREGYVITNRKNFKICARIKLADLHPLKKEKFWNAYNSYKQEHYPKQYLKKEILKVLQKHHTSQELAEKFNRSQTRIQDVLILLKESGKIKNYRVRSKDFWIRANQKTIIISSIKAKYLKELKRINSTKELAKKFKVCQRSAFRRLKELEKLRLVKRDNNKKWSIININKMVLIAGIEEAGRKLTKN